MTMRTTYTQVGLLATAQALFQTTSVAVVTVGGLAGQAISPDPIFATAPIASMVLGTAIATTPAALWMAEAGRRPGFLAGAVLGVIGGLIGAFGIWLGSLLVLAFGTFLVGAYQGFAQFYRFAAAEVSPEAFRSRAISFVMAGGVVAALAGPEIARLAAPMLEAAYAGSFIAAAAISLPAIVLMFGIDVPNTKTEQGTPGERQRPLSGIVLQPAYIVALLGAATGYGVMILAMTATPLAMQHHHHGLDEAARVIQVHVLAMFLPSFVTGSLIQRFGVLNIMLSGVALFAIHVVATLSGTGFWSFAAALLCLGVGWNFLFIGGTTLLTETYTTAERGPALAVNDLTINVIGFGASLASGALIAVVSWQTLNLVLLPWIAIAAASILWLVRMRRRAATIAAT